VARGIEGSGRRGARGGSHATCRWDQRGATVEAGGGGGGMTVGAEANGLSKGSRLKEPDLFSFRSDETTVPTLGCFIASFRKDAESSVLKVPPLLSCCPVLRRMGERKT
jgi:hypothetical protein